MRRICHHNRAHDDLEDIASYCWEKVDESFSNRVISGLTAATTSLLTHPERGQPKFHLMPELRMILGQKPAQRYKIYYRVMSETIEIVRILHGSQDAADAFEG